MEIIKCIANILLIAIVSTALYLYIDKIKVNKILRFTVVGIIFGGLSFALLYLSVGVNDTYHIIESNTPILIAGLLFGGPSGVIAGILSSLLAYLANTNSIEIIKSSIYITLIFAGLFSTLLNKLIHDSVKVKWHYGIIASLITESFGLLMIFITNLNDLSAAYNIVNSSILWTYVLNIISIGIALVTCALFSKKQLFSNDKPKSIQTKVQFSLAFVIIICLSIVSFISYSILDNNNKTSIKDNFIMNISDTKSNLISDLDTDIISKAQSVRNEYNKTAISRLDIDSATKRLGESVDLWKISFLAYINADGTVKVASNDYFMKDVKNISDLNITQFDYEAMEPQVCGYEYIKDLDAYYKLVYFPARAMNSTEYLLIGFNETLYNTYIKNSIDKGVASRHLGENGFLLVTDKDKNIISSPNEDISGEFEFNDIDSVSTISINDIEYYSYVTKFQDYYFVGLMNKADSDLNTNISIYITALTLIILFFILYSIIYLFINKAVVIPLKNVNNSLEHICEGKLDEEVKVHSNKEMKSLSDGINTTVLSLKEHIGREAMLIQKELNFAKQIQLSALPISFPTNNKFDLYASMNAAKEVGGDFYDFYFIDDEHLCVLIADVSGKGVPAAMFMMQAKSILKSLIENNIPLDEAFNQANAKLCESNTTQMFVTVWCGILDLNNGILKYVNAGHNPPLIKHNGKYEFMTSKPNFILAGMETSKYKLQQIDLASGDEIFLYTDGVTEATSLDKKLYGEDNLLAKVNSIKANTSKEFCTDILSSIKEFTKEAEQSDDITMLHIRYRGMIK